VKSTIDTNPPDNVWNETDITLSHAREIIPSLTEPFLPSIRVRRETSSIEVFAGISCGFPWLEVGVSVYREVYHFPCWWVQLDISKGFPLP
jgi:hypothetical protein